MIKKFTNRLCLACLLLASLVGCEDELDSPEKSTLAVDKTTGLVGDTEFTFTVSEVNAQSISLLPYGYPGGDAGIRVTSFSGGKATVKVTYSKPGTFQAVVVSNNHSDDGDVVNVVSEPVTITIESDDAALTAFSFKDISTKTEIDQANKTIEVTVPHAYVNKLGDLKATFTSSSFSTVKVGATTQTSGTTPNDFDDPVVYTVVANNGDDEDYTVTVLVTPIQTDNTIKSATAKATSKPEDKGLQVSVDNVNRTLVVYDVLGTPSTTFDSVRIGYSLNASLAYLKFGGKKLKQDSLFNLAAGPVEEFVVFPEDSTVTGTATYEVYAVAAPKLNLAFPELNPAPIGLTPSGFNYDIRVLENTDVTDLVTTATVTTSGNTVSSIKVVGGPTLPAGTPVSVDYTIPQKIELTVTDTALGVTYKVIYNVSVTVIN
jgi:hypothetical protein